MQRCTCGWYNIYFTSTDGSRELEWLEHFDKCEVAQSERLINELTR